MRLRVIAPDPTLQRAQPLEYTKLPGDGRLHWARFTGPTHNPHQTAHTLCGVTTDDWRYVNQYDAWQSTTGLCRKCDALFPKETTP